MNNDIPAINYDLKKIKKIKRIKLKNRNNEFDIQ